MPMNPRDDSVALPKSIGLPWPVDPPALDRWGTELLGACLTILPCWLTRFRLGSSGNRVAALAIIAKVQRRAAFGLGTGKG
jgi:hypothetical protein